MTSLNIIAFIFALIGAGLSIFQPVISIPSFGAGYNFGGFSFLDILIESPSGSDAYLGALEIIIVALIAIVYGFCTLLRLTTRQHIIGLTACSIWLFVRIGIFLSNTNSLQRSFAGGFMSYQKTLLIRAWCYAISAICAYIDKNSVQTQNTSTPISTSSYSNTSQTSSLLSEIPKTEIKTPKEEKIFEPVLGIETQALVKRAFIFMDDNNIDEAERYLEQALRQDPENSLAYIGKLMIELKVHNLDELSNISSSLKEQKLFQRALKFANDEKKIKLERCLEVNEKNLEAKKQANNEQKYIKALTMKEKISSSSDAQNIINLLTSIVPYKDSEALIQEIRPIKKKFEELEKKYSEAWSEKRAVEGQKKADISEFNRVAGLFELLGDYKDCKSLAEEIRRSGIERTEKAKKDKKTTIILAIVLVAVIGGVLLIKFYQSWNERAEQEKIEQARIEAEKKEEKSSIETLKLELQNRKSNENGN